MAQRAYRQRKESTLEDLRKRVSELTNTVELMNKAFSDCRDRLSATPGLPRAALWDLRETSLQFDTLATDIRNPAEEDLSDSSPPMQSPLAAARPHEDPLQRSTVIMNVPSWLDQSALQQEPKPTTLMDVGLGYTMYTPEAEEFAQAVECTNFGQRSQAIVPFETSDQALMLTDFDVPAAQLPTNLQILHQPTPPMTYSFQETSFGRRLHRASLEAGYHLALDPTTRRGVFEKVFRLSLMGRDRTKLIATLKAALGRRNNEPLDFWEAPLIHVGGAGTHYPRRDGYGSLQPRNSSYNLGLIGPQTLALLDDAAKNNLSTDMTVEVAGYEGEWFDPYDVEGYLEERGIRIDPYSSFAEAEVTEWPTSPTSATTESSTGVPSTPAWADSTLEQTTLVYAEQQPLSNTCIQQADKIKLNDLNDATFTDVGYSDALIGSWMDFPDNGQALDALGNKTQATWGGLGKPEHMHAQAAAAISSSTASKPSKSVDMPTAQLPQKILIDVAKLVATLITSGICLGRTPGFRRPQVDEALALASFKV